MAIIQQDSQKSGSSTGHSRAIKKRKGRKICPEKFPGTKIPAEVIGADVEKPEMAGIANDRQAPASDSAGTAKAPQLEKRKQDGNEWKALKKTDYQRLETVLEEVQSSGEATSSKSSSDSGKSGVEKEQIPWDVAHGRARKPWLYNLMSITEHPEVLSGDEAQSEEEQEKQTVKVERSVERIDTSEAHGEPVESISKDPNGKFAQDKRSVLLNGMMEILPIFSNDKFVCSRDAISIEECEELDGLDKTLPSSGKFIIDSKTSKDSRTIDIKPFHSVNSVKKGFRDRLTEKLGSFKETVGGKLQCAQQSIFPENIAQQSSHFINFLLVLTPFAEERERLLIEKNSMEEDVIVCKGSVSEETQAVRGGGSVDFCTFITYKVARKSVVSFVSKIL